MYFFRTKVIDYGMLISGRPGSIALPVVTRIILLVIMSCMAILNANGAFNYYGTGSENDTVMARRLLTERGEVYISFYASASELNRLGRIMSVDRYDDGMALANLNTVEFEIFLKEAVDFIVHSPAPGWKLKDKTEIGEWDYYPSYTEYVEMMQSWAEEHNEICEYFEAGRSVEDRKILFLKISGSDQVHRQKPRLMYTSTIHGDETAGFVLLLRLIEYLLESYKVEQQITTLLDNTEIWINPLANPDGAYFGGGGNEINSPLRRNANGVDLNRDFPQLISAGNTSQGREPETAIMMELLDSGQFVLSANIHGGQEVMNYPWDYWQRRHADDNWFDFICREYADSAQYYSPAGYMTFLGGVTNGYQWYSVTGSRQDYVTYFTGGREVTMEISETKHPPPARLPDYWEYNKRSLVNFMEQVMFGISGQVRDALTGLPVKARVEILSHDIDSSEVFSNPENGWYFRLVEQGNFDIGYTSDGYYSSVIKDVAIWNRSNTRLDVFLDPVASAIVTPADEDGDQVDIYPSPVIDFINIKLILSGMSAVKIEIIDQSGIVLKQLYKGLRAGGINNFSFYLSDIPSGIYILRMQFGSSLISRKFIKAG